MEPSQTYKLLHRKGHHKENEKTTYRMGENICKCCNQQGHNFQNIQQLIQLNIKKQTTQSKTGQKTKIDISPKKT